WLVSLSQVGQMDFFFQAEDGIRDRTVTGVQTCALPILTLGEALRAEGDDFERAFVRYESARVARTARVVLMTREMGRIYHAKGEIGRASCRERGERPVVRRDRKQKMMLGRLGE